MNFEKHKDGRTHVHGTIAGVSERQMGLIQGNINDDLGYDQCSIKIFFYKRSPDIGWDKYCHKMDPSYGDSSAKASPIGNPNINKLIQEPALIECARPAQKKSRDDEFMDRITIDIFKTDKKKKK
jgi:hypothetical protein